MVRRRIAIGSIVVSVATALAAQQAQPQFRAGVDLVQLDVTVLDRDRRPITGLNAADFTVLENGKPRPIQAFSSVDLPPAPSLLVGPAGWRGEVPADVVTNQVSPSRIVVLLIDDNSVMSGGTATAGSWAVAKVRETARTLIDGLDPTDLAAVVFTYDNRVAQSLTLDRRRLRSAVERSAIFPGSSIDDENEGDAESTTSQQSYQTARCPLCTLRSLRQVTEALQGFPDRRKEVIFISRGFSLRDAAEVRIFTEAMQFAQAANIAIHPMDPAGLLTYATTAQTRGMPARGGFVSTIRAATESLRALSDHTGTRAVVNNNDPETQITRILDESRHYYLLGFVPADLTPDGKKRKIEVKVNRKGVDVRARNGYYPPAAATSAASHVPPAERAIASLLPQADIPLDVSLTAVAGPAGPEVAAVLGVRRVPPHDAGATTSAEEVEVVAQILDQYGRKRGIERRTVRLTPTKQAAGGGYYELLSRLPTKPGRYEIRLGVSSGRLTGSVYGYVEVPDFTRAPLAVSGWAIAAAPGAVQAPADVLTQLMPIVPTSRRTFSSSETVQGWLRIYQRAAPTPLPLTVEMTVLDSSGSIRTTERRTFAPETFAAGRSADYLCPVPLSYGPGEYLLDATIHAGSEQERRSVRYTVR